MSAAKWAVLLGAFLAYDRRVTRLVNESDDYTARVADLQPTGRSDALTLEQAAKVAGVHRNTVLSWLKAGDLRSLSAADVLALKERLHDE